MKYITYILASALFIISAVSCDKDEAAAPGTDKGNVGGTPVPEGWFVATFTPDATRAEIHGSDERIQHLRYIVFDAADGNSFVKERVIDVEPNQQWPMTGGAITDTLPAGSYIAVFLGNVDPSIFNYAGDFEVLTGYRNGYSQARISLPPVEFTNTTEYYMAQALFSDAEPASRIILQRIIGRTKLKRITVDIQDALNTLVENLLADINYKELLGETVDGLLRELLPALIGEKVSDIADPLALIVNGLLTVVLDPILNAIVDPITSVLYELVVSELINHVGEVLGLNTDAGGLGYLTSPLLNPWGALDASSTLVTISDFPKSIDFDFNTTEFFPDGQRFNYNFNTLNPLQEHYITIKGFGGEYNVEKINVLRSNSLVGGIVVNNVVDDFLLTGAFINVDDPKAISQATNMSVQTNYSLVGIGVADDNTPGDPYPFSTTIRLGDVANLDGLLNGALGGLLTVIDGVLSPISFPLSVIGIELSAQDLVNTIVGAILDLNITIALPVDLPLLEIDNLSLAGSWSAVEPWDGD